MHTRTKITGAAAALCLTATLGMGPGAMAAQPAAGPMAVPAQTQVDEGLPVTGEGFTGTINDLTAEIQDGDLVLTGTISGILDGVGQITDQPFTAPVEDIFAEDDGEGGPGRQGCDILNLDLGPLDLNLLGLQIDLQPIVLDITAVPGAGNLLGNLLCAVAGLLDGAGNPLNAITNLLNRLLGGLGLAA
jgi:hypothetical protein